MQFSARIRHCGSPPPTWRRALEGAGAAGVGVLGVTRYTHAEIKPHVAAYRAAIRTATPIGRFVNDHAGVFAIGCVHDDDRIGREVGRARRRGSITATMMPS